MAKGRSTELGDILSAVENASDLQLRELKQINKKLASSGLQITRTNAGPSSQTGEARAGNMREYNRSKDKVKVADTVAIQKVVERAVRQAAKRDARGRFMSANGPAPVKNPRPPRQPKGGSAWSSPPSKSDKAQSDKKADAQLEAVEEQTKETIARQDETNDLLKELVKETKKAKKQQVVSGGGGSGGLDIDIGGGGLFKKMRRFGRKILGKRGAKIAAGAAVAAGGAGLAGETSDVADTVKNGPVRGANGRFLSKAEREAAAAGEHSVAKLATKGGLKAVGKIGLRAIPIIGTAINAGMDAVEGWNDTEAQNSAFNTNNVSTQQKAEYTAANVADMGGLVSDTSSLLGMGADALGFHDAAKAMTFTTADMARGLDDMGNGISDSWDAFKEAFTGDSKDKDKNDDQRNQKLVDIINSLKPAMALGLQNGAGNAPHTEFANDNPAQAAMRNQRNTTAVEEAQQSQNAMKYGGMVDSSAQKFGVDSKDINTIIGKESSWNVTAASGTGPVGLGQISEGKAKDLGYSLQDRLDPQKNIDMTAKLWSKLLKRYHGNKRLALLAYNQGEGAGDKAAKGGAVSSDGAAYVKRYEGMMDLNGYGHTGAVDTKGGAIGDGNAPLQDGTGSSGVNPLVATFMSAYHGGDKAFAELIAKNGVGTFGGAPSKGLDMPAGWQKGGSNFGDIVAGHAGQLGQWLGGVTPGSSAKGIPAGAAGGASGGIGAGIASILRGSAADTFNWATQGISGSNIIDGLMGGVNPLIADVAKPLTDLAGKDIDSLLGTGRSAITDMINGRPTRQGSVTDLAGSGATPTVSRDDGTIKAANTQENLLQRLVDGLEKLIGVTEDGNKQASTVGSKNEPKATAQPGPSGDIPLMSGSKALLQLIEDVL